MCPHRLLVCALALAGLIGLGPAESAATDLPNGAGTLLPLRDRVGDPEIANQVEAAMALAIGPGQIQVAGESLRPVMRSLRLRDISAASPDELARLTEVMEVAWFLSATLHEAQAGPLPRITLSARLYVNGSPKLHWAGFTSLTGADELTWLALGGVDDLPALIHQAVRRLLAPLMLDGRQEGQRRTRPLAHAFLRSSQPAAALSGVAVVPFDSVTDQRPGETAELVTAAAEAALYEGGYQILFPGAVIAAMRRSGRLLRGELDTEVRRELALAGADRVFTGTIETYAPGGGLLSNPQVAVSARLLDTGDGRIVWTGGDERFGSDGEGLFRRGRILSGGYLTTEIMRSMVAGFSVR